MLIMDKTNNYNVRSSHGKLKGKFISLKRKAWREKQLESAKKFKKCESPVLNLSNLSGRRVVELKVLAQELWCKKCDNSLSLRDVVEENCMGLASILKIQCLKCQQYFHVRTNKSHDSSNRLYDVNYKLSIGMIDAGLGESQINTFLSAMNIPTVSSNLIKRHERLIGTSLEGLANESCEEALKLEKKITDSLQLEIEDNNVSLTNDSLPSSSSSHSSGVKTKIAASIDTAWLTKASGRSYNSSTGHASLIGEKCKKIISYATRSKICAKCRAGNPKSDHDCRENHFGSSKSMEPDMGIQLVAKNPLLKKENVSVSVLIGDDDSSTIAAVRREGDDKVDKWSDMNHTKNSFMKPFYNKKINPTIVKYLGYCFTCAIKTNKNDVQGVQNALRNITPHVFGEHANCGEWCKYRNITGDYVHNKLPGSKPLSDPKLRTLLSEVIERYANVSEKLAPCASSQSNESFNNMVTSKHPKNRHYGGSESFDFRVAAAVCQKNIGTEYVCKLNKKLCLSPGKNTEKYRKSKEKIRSTRSIKESTVEHKKRRATLKKQKKSSGVRAEREEGVTYESGCGLSDVSQVLPQLVMTNTNIYQKVTSNDKIHLVIFDLETSALGDSAEICQIAASCDGKNFNIYIMPSRGITVEASRITKLTICEGEMFLENNRVETKLAKEAHLDFMTYLKNFGGKVILVAHNGFRFDAPKILKASHKLGILNEFFDVVIGFADSLEIFKKKLVQRQQEKKSFSLENLAADYLTPDQLKGAHNAIFDVSMVLELFTVLGVSEGDVKDRTKPAIDFWNAILMKPVYARNKSDLDPLKKIISATMINKIVKAGITMSMLKTVHKHQGIDGIRLLFGESVNKKPRITNNGKVYQAVCDKLDKINSA